MQRSDIQDLIDAIQDGVPNTALKVRTVLNAIADGTDQTGDIKVIDVTNAYMSANFDVTGLGTNERLGWAICNGSNGTRNSGGRVTIPYQISAYPTLGATGGNNSVTLTKNNIPTLDATFPVTDGDNAGGSKVYIMANDYDPSGSKLYANTINVGSTNTAVDIRQQYLVRLEIMKL